MPLPNYVAPGQSYVTPEQAASSNAAAIPGGPNLTAQLVSNLSGGLHGELPEDVKNLIQQEAAQNGVASGTGGSQFADYQGLRTLGLTSLSRMQHTEDSLVNPLLGPRQYPHAPYIPPFSAPQGSGGFGNTTPHYNVGPIGGGGGHPGGAPTLPTYSGGTPPGGTSTGNILNELLTKYGPIGNSGSSPMGTYGGSPLNMAGLNGGQDQYGYGNDQDWAPTTSAQDLGYSDAMAEDQQNLSDAGFNSSDFYGQG